MNKYYIIAYIIFAISWAVSNLLVAYSEQKEKYNLKTIHLAFGVIINLIFAPITFLATLFFKIFK